jgi:hypothetical protein
VSAPTITTLQCAVQRQSDRVTHYTVLSSSVDCCYTTTISEDH